jgi:hypothetical protein
MYEMLLTWKAPGVPEADLAQLRLKVSCCEGFWRTLQRQQNQNSAKAFGETSLAADCFFEGVMGQ